MKGTAIVASLCCIMAVGLAYPRPPAYLMTEEFEAQTQWHLSAPSQGCVEVSHSVGGATFRTYACDGANGACIYSPVVTTCPFSALYHQPSLERVVNIRTRDHLVRYYNQIGGACVFTVLPNCCSSAMVSTMKDDSDCFCIMSNGEKICEPANCGRKAMNQADECKCLTLPSGKKICDPIGCGRKAMNQADECKCLTLPNGEKICDPIGCGRNAVKIQEDKCRCETLPTGEKVCDPVGCQH